MILLGSAPAFGRRLSLDVQLVGRSTQVRYFVLDGGQFSQWRLSVSAELRPKLIDPGRAVPARRGGACPARGFWPGAQPRCG